MTTMLLLIVILLGVWHANAMVSLSKKEENSHFEFLEKFCFDSTDGKVTLFIDADRQYDNYMNILFYADMEDQWPAIYGHEIRNKSDCIYKEQKAALRLKVSTILQQETPLTVDGSRPRWWYIAVSNCDDPVIALPYYNITMTNGDASNRYVFHFGKDEQGVLETQIFFFCVNLAMLAGLYYAKIVAKSLDMQYRVLQLLFVSVMFSCAALMFGMIHRGEYARDGIGIETLDDLAYFLEAAAQLTQMLVLLNLSRGQYVSTNHADGQRLTVFVIIIFLVLYLVVHLNNLFESDPGEVLYIYDSVPGYLLITMRIICTIWFWYITRKTLSIEQDQLRKVFYYALLVFGSCWFAALPVTSLIAVGLPSWNRAKIVFGLVQSVNTMMYFGFFYLFKPWGNKYIPVLGNMEHRAFDSHQLIFPMSQPSIPKTASGILHAI